MTGLTRDTPGCRHSHLWHLVRGLLPWRMYRVCVLCGERTRL